MANTIDSAKKTFDSNFCDGQGGIKNQKRQLSNGLRHLEEKSFAAPKNVTNNVTKRQNVSKLAWLKAKPDFFTSLTKKQRENWKALKKVDLSPPTFSQIQNQLCCDKRNYLLAFLGYGLSIFKKGSAKGPDLTTSVIWAELIKLVEQFCTPETARPFLINKERITKMKEKRISEGYFEGDDDQLRFSIQW